MNKKDIDYTKYYNCYKMLPGICGILTGVLSFLGSLFIAFSFPSRMHIVVIIIGAAVSTLLGVLVAVVMYIAVSPTIVSTDTLIEIRDTLRASDNTDKHQNSADQIDHQSSAPVSKTIKKRYRCPKCFELIDHNVDHCANCGQAIKFK